MAKNIITLDILLARKQQSENDKMRVVLFDSKVLGGTIEVIKHKARDVIKIMDSTEEKTTEAAYIANCKLIYKHCPIFQNKELQKTYEVVLPYEVIIPVLDENLGEVNNLADFILNLYGLGSEDLNKGKLIEEEVEEVKN